MLEVDVDIFKDIKKGIRQMNGRLLVINKVAAGEVTAGIIGNEAKMKGMIVNMDVFIPSNDKAVLDYNARMAILGAMEDSMIEGKLDLSISGVKKQLRDVDKAVSDLSVPLSVPDAQDGAGLDEMPDTPVPLGKMEIPKDVAEKESVWSKVKSEKPNYPDCFGTGKCVDGMDVKSCVYSSECQDYYPTDDMDSVMQEVFDSDGGIEQTKLGD